MIRPTSKDVVLLRDYDPTDFERWFITGLETHFDEGDDSRAFQPLDLFIGSDDELTLDLKNIYNALPIATTRSNFRLGLKLALSHFPENPRYVKHFKELLWLAAEIRAFEILPVLPHRVSNGFFGKIEGEHPEELFIVALETVAGFSEPDNPDIERCLNSLIKSKHFDRQYTDVAFLSLCRAKPESFPAHLMRLRGKMTALLENGEIESSNKRNLAHQFVECVSFNLIVENLHKLSLGSKNNNYPELDQWLVEGIFDSENPSLTCDFEDGEIYITPIRDGDEIKEDMLKLNFQSEEIDVYSVKWLISYLEKVDAARKYGTRFQSGELFHEAGVSGEQAKRNIETLVSEDPIERSFTAKKTEVDQ